VQAQLVHRVSDAFSVRFDISGGKPGHGGHGEHLPAQGSAGVRKTLQNRSCIRSLSEKVQQRSVACGTSFLVYTTTPWAIKRCKFYF